MNKDVSAPARRKRFDVAMHVDRLIRLIDNGMPRQAAYEALASLAISTYRINAILNGERRS